MKEKKLTFKQERFANEYIANNGNGVQAAKSAGYKGNNNYLAVAASRMIIKDKIKSRIDAIRAELAEKAHITVELIQKEHQRLQGLCERKGDLSTATVNLTGLGKTIGCYTDGLATTDLTKRAELDAEAKAEAIRIAGIRLRQG